MRAARERDYVLGTHDEEVERLGIQHRSWRPHVLAAWRRAGFTQGQTILDVGCGPGYASLDLAEMVGPDGRVIAVDRSRRFLDVLEAHREQRGFDNIETHEFDLDAALPDVRVDAAWIRWVFAFVQHPRALVTRLHKVLKPGGTLVIQEYIDYATWRAAPPRPELQEFVTEVMVSWRGSGGEPDIGLCLPHWLNELGFEVKGLQPIIEVVPRTDPMWLWLRTFMDSGRNRLADLGHITEEQSERFARTFEEIDKTPGMLMVTPAVLIIVAVRL